MEKEETWDSIQYLVEHLARQGKVKIQKSVYLLQHALGVDLGFEFVMHYYGPYSFGLESTLSEMSTSGVLAIQPYLYAGWQGFDISVSEGARKDLSLPSEVQDGIDRVASLVNDLDIPQLELWATTHFVYSILQEKGLDASRQSVVKEVGKLKPKFTAEEIGKVFDQLRQKSLLPPYAAKMIEP